MKTKFKKTLAILLAALMLIGVMPAMSLTAFADGGEYPALEADSRITVNGTGYTEIYFTFTPPKTDIYAFYTEGDANTCGFIKNPDSYYDSDLVYNDDNGEDLNFRVECVLSSEKTYTMGFYCVGDYTDEITVALDTLHSPVAYTDEDITLQPTCSAEGEAKTVCEYCEAEITVAIPVTDHTDTDFDGLCDNCSERICYYVTENDSTEFLVAPDETAEFRFRCTRSGKYEISFYGYCTTNYMDEEGNYIYTDSEGYYTFTEGETYRIIGQCYSNEITTASVLIKHVHDDTDGDLKCDICGVRFRYIIGSDETITFTVLPGERACVDFTPQTSGEYNMVAGGPNAWTSSLRDSENNYIYRGSYGNYELIAGVRYTITVNGVDYDNGNDSYECSAKVTHAHVDADKNRVCDKCEKTVGFDLVEGKNSGLILHAGETYAYYFTPEDTGNYNFNCSYGCYGPFDSQENGLTGEYNYSSGYYYELTGGQTYHVYVSNLEYADRTIEIDTTHKHIDNDADYKCDSCGLVIGCKMIEGEGYEQILSLGETFTGYFTCEETGKYVLLNDYGSYDLQALDSNGHYLYTNGGTYQLTQGETYRFIFRPYSNSATARFAIRHDHYDTNDDGKCDRCSAEYKYILTDEQTVNLSVPGYDIRTVVLKPQRTGKYRISGNTSYLSRDSVYDVESGYNIYPMTSDLYDLEAGKTYTVRYRTYSDKTGTGTIKLTHDHIDTDGDNKCDICEESFIHEIFEGQEFNTTIPANDSITLVFNCQRTGDYKIRNTASSLNSVRDTNGNYYYSDSLSYYSFENGVRYLLLFRNEGSSDSEMTALITHAHIDETGDGKCDLCSLEYIFTVTEDVPITVQIPKDDEIELMFTPGRTDYYKLDDSFSSYGYSVYNEKGEYVNSNWDKLNGSHYRLTEGKTYRFRIYSSISDADCKIKVTHAHTGEDRILIAPTAAAEGVLQRTCSTCSKTFCLEASCAGTKYAEGTENGFHYSVYTLNGVKEACIDGFEQTDSDTIVIPSEIGGYPVTSIDSAFIICECTSVTIPDTVVSICDGSFIACNNIESLTIPDSVVVIGDQAFMFCSSLKSVKLGKGVKFIGEGAFRCTLTEEEKQTIINELEYIQQEMDAEEASLFEAISQVLGTEITSWEQADEIIAQTENLDPEFLESYEEYRYAFRMYRKEIEIYTDAAELESEPLEEIIYAGSSADWKSVYVDSSNDEVFNNATFTFETLIASLIVDNEVWDTIEFTATQESINLPEVPKKTGYTGRWSDYILEAKDIEITAIYEAITYHATIKADGETITVLDFVYGDETLNLPEVPGKEGYTGSWPDYTLGAEDITIEAVYKINSYTVSYVVDGNTQTTADIEFGKSIIIPRSPEKKGYTFGGWVDADGKSPEDYDGMPAKNLTFEAVWTINQYTITFDTAGGSEIEAIKQNYDTDIAAPADPTREGYTFQGWKPEIPAKMPADDMTVVAQWKINQYTITFDTDGGNEIEAITQDYDTDITAPADPVKTGYTFTGWQPELPAKMPAENITVKAVYEQITYHATIKADGETITVIDFVYGQKSIALPDVPEKEGYTGSWPNYTLGAKDITIEAVYKINYYYAFYKDGDAEEMVACMEYGSPLLKPDTDPVKEGYTFGGWVDADGKSPEDYDGMPAKDLTFNAVWNINTYTVTFNTDGGSAIAPVNVTYGAAIPAPANPVKEGFVFTGWSPAIPATMPANDLTLTAQWLNPTANTVIKVGSDKKVDYKATVTVIAKAENVPDGCIVVICDESGAILARGDKSSASITFEEMTSGKTLVAKVIGAGDKVCKDGSGAEIAKSVKIDVKTGFFDKIIAFFRGLFKALPKETIQP